MFTWKTLNGKNHGSPQTPNYHYVRKVYKRMCRGNDVMHTVFAWRRLQTKNALYISLSLSVYLNNNYTNNTTRMATRTNKMFDLGHIYTNMTLRLFTNLAPICLHKKHIYEYVFLSSERLSPGPRRHVLPEYSSPGFTGSSSSDPCRVLFIRSLWSHPEGP